MTSRCPGCGHTGPDQGGTTHPYIGASAACWGRYGELLARPSVDPLAVDAYAAQHPGVDERRSRQSVAVHLISLCARLERDRPAADAVEVLRAAVATDRAWPWLDPVTPLGSITVDDVVAGRASVRAWGEDVWRAWSEHHPLVRGWTDALPD